MADYPDGAPQLPQWRRLLYILQLNAPKPKKVECLIEIPNRPSYYGTEFHGNLGRHETDDLLGEDGCYLVRESQKNPGCFTLVIRFENMTKNYKLYYDSEKNQHYVGEKYFDNLEDLVADGLICFYVHSKAPEYIINSMSNEPVYEESPYMRYREDMKRRDEIERKAQLVVFPAGNTSANVTLARTPASQEPALPPRMNSTRPPLPTVEPPKKRELPSAKVAGDWMEIMQQEKHHNFKITTFKSIALCWCDFCYHFMWGLIQQGVECQDCGFKAHKKCSERVPNDCMPSMKKLKRMFGLDLTTLLKATNKSIPFVVEKCVDEIERRGLHHEGLYRVPGFKDLVDEVQRCFDLEGNADITENTYEDIAVITSVLKSFFSQLPLPLITVEVYQKLIFAVSRNEVRDVKLALSQLPAANYQTLRYLINHLSKVAQMSDKNMMTAENLARVFAPTLLQSLHTNPIEAVKMGVLEQRAVEVLITQYSSLF